MKQAEVSKNLKPLIHTMDDYIAMIKSKDNISDKDRMNQYAMQILGKLPNRDEIFIET